MGLSVLPMSLKRLQARLLATLFHRHCQRSEKIQAVAAERFWIATLRSQR
jgi:hypothetical protein